MWSCEDACEREIHRSFSLQVLQECGGNSLFTKDAERRKQKYQRFAKDFDLRQRKLSIIKWYRTNSVLDSM